MKVALYLKHHPHVAWVRYPGLPEDPQYEKAQKYLKGMGTCYTLLLSSDMFVLYVFTSFRTRDVTLFFARLRWFDRRVRDQVQKRQGGREEVHRLAGAATSRGELRYVHFVAYVFTVDFSHHGSNACQLLEQATPAASPFTRPRPPILS